MKHYLSIHSLEIHFNFFSYGEMSCCKKRVRSRGGVTLFIVHCTAFIALQIAFKRLTSSLNSSLSFFSSSRSFFTRLNNDVSWVYWRSTCILFCSSSFHPCHIVHIFTSYIACTCLIVITFSAQNASILLRQKIVYITKRKRITSWGF